MRGAKGPSAGRMLGACALAAVLAATTGSSPSSGPRALRTGGAQTRPLAGALRSPLAAAAGAVLRIRGGSAYVAAPMRATSPPPPGVGTGGGGARESLGSQRARLKAPRPKLLSQVQTRPSPGGTAAQEKPVMLSLVNPLKDAEDHGEAKEVEDAKKFKAFQGTGNVLLSADQIKTASSSQMHRLAVARLARLNLQSHQQPSDEAQEVVSQETTEAEAKAFTASHFANPVERTEKLLAEAAALSAIKEAKPLDSLEGVTQGTDEHGNVWEHSWVINPETKARREYRSGRDIEGLATWQESSMLLEDGTYVSKGSNSQGHTWGEKAGTFANGTSWREKWLQKPEDGWYALAPCSLKTPYSLNLNPEPCARTCACIAGVLAARDPETQHQV